MGNSFGMKKTTKIMKINGEAFKLKTPVKAGDVLKDHPGLVLLESEAVKHYGTRAKPLDPNKDLLPKRLYFLVELPKETKPRRVRSGIIMNAKDRLESLMLTRRSASDLSILKQSNMVGAVGNDDGDDDEKANNNVNVNKENNGVKRLKMRLPRAEVEKLIQDCKDEAEAAKRIMSYYNYTNNNKANVNGTSREIENNEIVEEKEENKGMVLDQQWKGRGRDIDIDIENTRVVKKSLKAPREKKVSFMPISEGGIQIAVAS